MADYNEQLLKLWDEYTADSPGFAHSLDDLAQWAIERGKWHPRPYDQKKMLTRDLRGAIRQLKREDDEGTVYRAIQCAREIEDGIKMSNWFDVDKNGTARLRRLAIKQKRDSIAASVFSAKSDANHMNLRYPSTEPIQFDLDFTEDYEERKAEERMKRKERERKKIA